MTDALRRFLLALCLSGICACASAAEPRAFEEGMNAMLEGNFAEAYCKWKPLAEKGHAESQYNLGWLYANGNGMNVDVDQAMHWWKAAAEQGHADAQFAIGLALTTGEDVPQDLPQASSWFIRAARNGHRDSREILTRLNMEPGFDVVALHPELIDQPWFGWPGVISGERINVRAKPSTKAKIVAKLDDSTPVRVIGHNGDWLQAVLPGKSKPRVAWIYHSLVKRDKR
jgi:uncharacterized protein YgiM (DUF1202 family)